MNFSTDELLQILDLLRLEVQAYRNAGKRAESATLSALTKCNELLAERRFQTDMGRSLDALFTGAA